MLKPPAASTPPRGYRYIILAAVGWLIVSASNPKNPADKSEQGASSKVTQAAPSPTASPPLQPVHPPKYQPPCREPESNDRCNLEAAWKAADAGRDAADWAWVQMVLSAFGVAGLLYSLRLTRRAVKDTGNATVAMLAANDIALKAAKPRIIINLGSFSTSIHALSGERVHFSVVATNVGGAGCVISGVFHAWGKDGEPFPQFFTGCDQITPVPQGESRSIDPMNVAKAEVIRQPLLRGWVTCDGPFLEAQEKQIRFSFRVNPEVSSPHGEHYTAEHDPDWTEGSFTGDDGACTPNDGKHRHER